MAASYRPVSTHNVDREELDKFEVLAHRWWDPDGDFKPLHDINPLRLEYVCQHADVLGAPVLDVGCGGGLLTEALASLGATVTGSDMADKPVSVARLHALESGIEVEYLAATAEALAVERPACFGTVTCLEMLEHVPDYASTVRACADLTAPGGSVIFSTINRNPKSYALAVVGAEYILSLLPKGTHDYAKLIRPSELARAVRHAGLELQEIVGMRYNPFTRRARLSSDVDVNYLLYARKP